MTLILYPLAALAEIAGCFAFWAWLKLDRSPLWLVPGLLSLALFAWLLTLVPSDAAGRAYAAYGSLALLALADRGAKAGSLRPHGGRDLPRRGSGDPVAFKGLSGIPLKRQDAGLRNFRIYINYDDRLG